MAQAAVVVEGRFVACRAFQTIARTQGAKSQDKKIDLINKLLVSSSDVEPGFIMRALQVCHLISWPVPALATDST